MAGFTAKQHIVGDSMSISADRFGVLSLTHVGAVAVGFLTSFVNPLVGFSILGISAGSFFALRGARLSDEKVLTIDYSDNSRKKWNFNRPSVLWRASLYSMIGLAVGATSGQSVEFFRAYADPTPLPADLTIDCTKGPVRTVTFVRKDGQVSHLKCTA